MPDTSELRKLIAKYAHENRGSGIDEVELERFVEWLEQRGVK